MMQVAKSDHRLMQVLLAPVVSEKATLVAEKNEQIVLGVAHDANKGEVRTAVELLFRVEIEFVQILSQKGKQERFGYFTSRRDHVKRAYVSLKPGQEINFEAEAR